MEWKNELTRLLGITYPVIQAPMLGITTPAMVAAVSNSGGLGSLPVGGLSPEKAGALIREVKALTSAPFAVNMFVYDLAPSYDQNAFNEMQDFLQFLYGANRLAVPPVNFDTVPFYSWREQLPVIIAAGVKLVSFTFGMPDKEGYKLFKENQIISIGTATSVEEAVALKEAGTDIIVAQGIEAGGHRGSFLGTTLPQVGTMSLVPQIVDRIRVPVIAAGGIMDGRTLLAAFNLGAEGVQVGSLFLRSNESLATPAHKEEIAKLADTDTVLTKSFTGRWARGIRNKLLAEIEASGLPIVGYPYQNELTQPIRKLARELDKPEFLIMWAGQSAAKAKTWKSADIFSELIRETEALSR
ncbi:nitronate monooxygenase [Chitinophaga silvatica]|uniref:Nitronate monooxygenase n=1 Tax=Chitinophaga silvatica TaxID=2282649 RepID=A0A3E1Y304_9BACT|nr:nitronate monooxygenase family protein [Chitinophaga silvatica]RFS19090.1 nitronate monooxygenase [Chitinophaga silvatica]